MRETSPYARELRYVDHTVGETFFGPRLPARIDEVPSAPDVRVVVTESTRLGALAHEHYGDAALWWVIADVNDVMDPFNLPVGEELRIPARDRVLMEVLA